MSRAAPGLRRVDGSSLSIGIVASEFNRELVDALLGRVVEKLAAAGVPRRSIELIRVPGSHELPWAAQELGLRRGRHCVIALGVLIGGETSHHEVVGASVSHALQRVALKTRVPVVNGVIVADTRAQAEARCRGRIDRGGEFAGAALAMAALRKGRSR